MRYFTKRGILLFGLVVFVMVFGAACDPKSTAVDQIADTMIVEGKTLFAPTDTPVPPTKTPSPPTDTPVPTEVSVGMLDEEGDCEVVSGSIGEDGCQIDVASFYAYPCYGEDKVLFEVGFTKFPEMKTWDMCFVINADNDPTTGFQDPPMEGNEYYYCWGNEQEMIFYNRFSGAGDFLNEIPVADPQMYVVSYPDSANVDSHFGMTYPPPDTVDPEYADSPYVVFAEAHYYDPTTGVWVRDIAGPAFLEGCPPQ